MAKDQLTHDLPKTSAPARRALDGAGITSLAQLARYSEKEIAALHGMGPKAIGILREALAAKGLSFADKK
jgi:predicted flap endonuclease-1-like 5' DNA nuclease